MIECEECNNKVQYCQCDNINKKINIQVLITTLFMILISFIGFWLFSF